MLVRALVRRRRRRRLGVRLRLRPLTPRPDPLAALRSRRLREFALLALGVITPVGILAVNASAFVMGHLVVFRTGIAACAVVSGLVLNGLTAWWLMRLVSRHNPPLYREYRPWAIGGSILIVLLTAAAGGYLTYLGLRDPRRLPDALSVIVATVMILTPFAISLAARRWFGLGGIIPVEEPLDTERSPRRSGGSMRSRT